MKTLSSKEVEARAKRALRSVRNDLSANVLVRRATLRLSQADLAERSGVSRPVISKLETATGDFQISALARIAAVLGCPVAELFEAGRVRAVSDAEIVRRFSAPQNEFISGTDLWAAIDEVTASRRENTTKQVGRRIPPRGNKRTASSVIHGTQKRKT